MSNANRRGSASPELLLNLVLFVVVAGVGWTSPTAFHDALMGVTELAPRAVHALPVREGVPDLLTAPHAVVIPLWSEPSAAELRQEECARHGKADPWTSDACSSPVQDADGTPWASTPWGVE